MDHVAAEVVLGQLKVSYNTGGVQGIRTATLSHLLNDGQYHQVKIVSSPPSVTVSIDDGTCVFSNCSVTLQSSPFKLLNAKNPIYVGGMNPSVSVADSIITTSGFIGCIKDFTVDGTLHSLLGMNAVYRPEPGCRNDSLCSSRPCLNGATCIDRWESVACQCAPGFEGDFCQIQLSANFTSSQFLFFDFPNFKSLNFSFTAHSSGVLLYTGKVRKENRLTLKNMHTHLLVF